GDLAPVDLLGHVAEEGQRAVWRNGGGERAQHLRREVLPLVDHDVPVHSLAAVALEFSEHCARDVIPVIAQAGLPANPPVFVPNVEQCRTEFASEARPATEALGGDVLLITQPVPVDEADLL